MKSSSLLLERDLQTELDISGASGTDDRVPGIDVGSAAGSADTRGRRGVILSAAGARRRAIRVGEDGTIEEIEELRAELHAEAFFEGEVLKDREIHVPEARVAEDIAAHGAKCAKYGRDHDRISGDEAAARA